MASRRTKKSIKNRPKYQQDRALKCRRKKSKLAAKRRRGLNRAKARRQRRSSKRTARGFR